MKKIIRRRVFESNSSSSHSVSIMREPQEVQIPDKIHFEVHQFHDYPWDDDYMDELSGRANYLYACALQTGAEEMLKQTLHKLLPNTELIFDLNVYGNEWCYLINHQAYETAKALVIELLGDKGLLLNYLFDDKTDIAIAGDWVGAAAKQGKDRIYFNEFGRVIKGEEDGE